MNKTFKLAAVAFGAALVLGGCTKENVRGMAAAELIEYTIRADIPGESCLNIDTKVALNSDGKTPNWESGDKILVLDSSKNPVGTDGLFTLKSGAGTKTGLFTCKVATGQTPAYAIYPASAYNASTGKFTLPTAQDGTKATAFKSYAVMMGSISNGSVTFSNVCSVLKLNTGDCGKSGGDPAIKSVKIGAATSNITGEFVPDWTHNTIAPASDGTASQNVTATATAATGYAHSIDIYLPIFPVVSSQTFTFEFTNTEGKVATVTVTFASAANKIKDIGIVGGGMEFIAP